MHCKHLAYESTIYKDTLVITVCSLLVKSQKAALLRHHHHPHPPSHVSRIAPGALVRRTPPNTHSASPAMLAAATHEQLKSPWELGSLDILRDLCCGFFACRLRKLFFLKLFFILFLNATPNPICLKSNLRKK